MTLSVPLPRYPLKGDVPSGHGRTPGLRWRREVFDRIHAQAETRGVRYDKEDRVRVKLLLRLTNFQMRRFDVDNLVKHVGDALQGTLAGHNKKKKHPDAVLPNDWQIVRWVVEKLETATVKKHKSRLLVQKYSSPSS